MEAARFGARRPALAGAALVIAAGLIARRLLEQQ